jgi:hypothetical protein
MRNNIEALTLLESCKSESQNIGTVFCGWNKRELIEQKITNAIEAHFDSTVTEKVKIDWGSIEAYQDLDVVVHLLYDGNYYQTEISIQQTVIY